MRCGTLFLLCAVLALAGCRRDSSQCRRADDCFRGETCASGECVRAVVIAPDAGSGDDEACDPDSCRTSLTKSTVCIGPNCVVALCGDGAVFCDEGCCPAEDPPDATYALGTELVGELDVVVDAEGRPSIWWFDFEQYSLLRRMWDGATWRVDRPAFFPTPSWDYDVALDGNGRTHVLYTGHDGSLQLASQNDAGGWSVERVAEARGELTEPTDPAFIEPALAFFGEKAVACYLYGTEDEALGNVRNEGFPEVWTAFFIPGVGWSNTKIERAETGVQDCSIRLDSTGRQQLFYSILTDDETALLRLAERTDDGEWTFDATIEGQGFAGRRGSVVQTPDGTLRVLSWAIGDTGLESFPAIFENTRAPDRDFEQTVLHTVDVSSTTSGIPFLSYRGTDEDPVVVWNAFQLDPNEFWGGWAKLEDGRWVPRQFELEHQPDWYSADVFGDRLHWAYMDLAAQTLYHGSREME